jgi:transposase
MALSSDLRLRLVDLVSSGVSRREAARRFKVSASSAIRFVKQMEEAGHLQQSEYSWSTPSQFNRVLDKNEQREIRPLFATFR